MREIERRIQKVEAYNKSGELREIPTAPVGVPDSFDEHVRLMFDLQALAFASDTTRVFSFKMGRDASSRVYPTSGVTTGFHPASHHGDREDRILDFAKINRYHVGMLPYFLKKLKETPDGESNLLDNTLVVYGSPMGDSNIHNHKRCPLFFAGKAGGALKGGLHIKAADGTPMANAMLAALQGIGVDDCRRSATARARWICTRCRPRRRPRNEPRRHADTDSSCEADRSLRAGLLSASRFGLSRGRADRECRAERRSRIRARAAEEGPRRQRGAGRRHRPRCTGRRSRATPKWRRC